MTFVFVKVFHKSLEVQEGKQIYKEKL